MDTIDVAVLIYLIQKYSDAKALEISRFASEALSESAYAVADKVEDREAYTSSDAGEIKSAVRSATRESGYYQILVLLEAMFIAIITKMAIKAGVKTTPVLLAILNGHFKQQTEWIGETGKITDRAVTNMLAPGVSIPRTDLTLKIRVEVMERVSGIVNQNIMQTVNALDRVAAIEIFKAAGTVYFYYDGPKDEANRYLCMAMNYCGYTLEMIDKCDNGHTGSLRVAAAQGGYGCRHRWFPVTEPDGNKYALVSEYLMKHTPFNGPPTGAAATGNKGYNPFKYYKGSGISWVYPTVFAGKMVRPTAASLYETAASKAASAVRNLFS